MKSLDCLSAGGDSFPQRTAADEGASGIIEIPADTVINTNTVWDQDVHLQGAVYVENAMLVLKPGIEVWNSPEFGRIIVRNSGIIKATGTPDERIYFLSDTGQQWEGYNYAIKIEPTASPLCEIQYCVITDAYYGIWIQDKRLENPVSDNEVWYCHEGILQEGPMLTDVINNHVYQTGHVGIYIYFTDVNGVASPDAGILIENNLVNGNYCGGYGQDIGIGVIGPDDPNNAGTVIMANNHIDGSYMYAVYQEGWQEAYRICNGYSSNYEISNPGNPFEDIGGVFMEFGYDPFYYSYDTPPFYLKQDSPLINAGLEYVEETTLIGKTTDVNGTPDSNIIDIGFHYPNWQFSNAGSTALSADLNNDYSVDLKDLALFLEYWLYDYAGNYENWQWDYVEDGRIDFADLAYLLDFWPDYFNFEDFTEFAEHWMQDVDYSVFETRADLHGDHNFDFADFVVLASQWQKTCEPLPPDISPTFNQDPNNLSGFTQISTNLLDLRTYRMFVLLDGQKYSEFFDLDELITGIQTDNFTNGRHSFKIVRIEGDGSIICSRPYDVNFNNEVSCITADSGYSSDNGYSFYAFGAAGQSFNVEINDLINNNVVYTSDFNDNINLQVPVSSFTEPYHIYSVAVSNGASELVNRIMAREFKYDVIDANVKMVISIGDKDMNDKDVSTIIPAVVKATLCQDLKMQYLPYADCTWKNLSRLLKDYPNVTYWYHDAHGNYQVRLWPDTNQYAQRTNVGIKNNTLFSKLREDYGSSVPSNYQDLGIWEYCYSIAELGFESSPKLEYIRMNACYSARYPDFAVAAGIISGDPYYDPLGERIYIGWNDVAYFGDWYLNKWFIPIPVYYKTFEIFWFYHQCIGDSVGRAVTNAIWDQPLIIRNILWDGLYLNIKVWGANWFYFYFGQ